MKLTNDVARTIDHHAPFFSGLVVSIVTQGYAHTNQVRHSDCQQAEDVFFHAIVDIKKRDSIVDWIGCSQCAYKKDPESFPAQVGSSCKIEQSITPLDVVHAVLAKGIALAWLIEVAEITIPVADVFDALATGRAFGWSGARPPHVW